jgi:hypothetical protein
LTGQNLIGIAFDGNSEALSGDIVFEPEWQKINVDVRLFFGQSTNMPVQEDWLTN